MGMLDQSEELVPSPGGQGGVGKASTQEAL